MQEWEDWGQDGGPAVAQRPLKLVFWGLAMFLIKKCYRLPGVKGTTVMPYIIMSGYLCVM